MQAHTAILRQRLAIQREIDKAEQEDRELAQAIASNSGIMDGDASGEVGAVVDDVVGNGQDSGSCGGGEEGRTEGGEHADEEGAAELDGQMKNGKGAPGKGDTSLQSSSGLLPPREVVFGDTSARRVYVALK